MVSDAPPRLRQITKKEKTMLHPSLSWRGMIAPLFVLLLTWSLCTGLQDQAAAATAQTGNFSFETAEGLSVVPLPDGPWHQVFKEETPEEMDMGTTTETWNKITIFLAPAAVGPMRKLIEISANASVIEVKDNPPDDFCYAKQRTWEWHKQISAITADTFCWGVRSMDMTENLTVDPWQELIEKTKKTKSPLPFDAAATQVRFFRSVKGQFLRIDYYFIAPKGGKAWNWLKARDWARGLVSRVKAGFEGKSNGGH